ncbi:MAG: DUF2811 domain-containing protein [Spirulinaceae cyanobacterium RM2_2_10]|nr:DUF2811 domain-containing protein [Spirulinaceae cyanobacterium SM2_1_0]NJO21121.1 DUF2811 domain-containing protein [Spirulinaceae cyanobacterium RM2_2_10]
MNANISILTEIPEELYYSIRTYLDEHPTWDQDQVFTTALSLFLGGDRSSQPTSEVAPADRHTRIYLETLYRQPS